jgi:hypothetical protein
MSKVSKMGIDGDIKYENFKLLLKSGELGKNGNIEFNIKSSPLLQ